MGCHGAIGRCGAVKQSRVGGWGGVGTSHHRSRQETRRCSCTPPPPPPRPGLWVGPKNSRFRRATPSPALCGRRMPSVVFLYAPPGGRRAHVDMSAGGKNIARGPLGDPLGHGPAAASAGEVLPLHRRRGGGAGINKEVAGCRPPPSRSPSRPAHPHRTTGTSPSLAPPVDSAPLPSLSRCAALAPLGLADAHLLSSRRW